MSTVTPLGRSWCLEAWKGLFDHISWERACQRAKATHVQQILLLGVNVRFSYRISRPDGIVALTCTALSDARRVSNPCKFDPNPLTHLSTSVRSGRCF